MTEGYFRDTSHITQKIPQEPLHQLRWFPSPKGEAFFYQAPLEFLGSPLGHPQGVPCAELAPQVTEGLSRSLFYCSVNADHSVISPV